jgi:hypothetical protein
MKVTAGLAMRARDVSRPRPEQLADAAAREESVPARVRRPRRGAAQAQPPVPRPAPPTRQAPVSVKAPGAQQNQAAPERAAPGQAPEPREPRARERKRRRR